MLRVQTVFGRWVGTGPFAGRLRSACERTQPLLPLLCFKSSPLLGKSERSQFITASGMYGASFVLSHINRDSA